MIAALICCTRYIYSAMHHYFQQMQGSTLRWLFKMHLAYGREIETCLLEYNRNFKKQMYNWAVFQQKFDSILSYLLRLKKQKRFWFRSLKCELKRSECQLCRKRASCRMRDMEMTTVLIRSYNYEKDFLWQVLIAKA